MEKKKKKKKIYWSATPLKLQTQADAEEKKKNSITVLQSLTTATAIIGLSVKMGNNSVIVP